MSDLKHGCPFLKSTGVCSLCFTQPLHFSQTKPPLPLPLPDISFHPETHDLLHTADPENQSMGTIDHMKCDSYVRQNHCCKMQ